MTSRQAESIRHELARVVEIARKYYELEKGEFCQASGQRLGNSRPRKVPLLNAGAKALVG